MDVLEAIFEAILIFVSFLQSALMALYQSALMLISSLNLLPLFDFYLPSVLSVACGIGFSILLLRFFMNFK